MARRMQRLSGMPRKKPGNRRSPAKKPEKLSAKRKVKARLRARRAATAAPDVLDLTVDGLSKKAGTN
jgi:hypothetical protein